MLLLTVVCAGTYSIRAGQDANWDFLNYHLYNPYAFVHGRLQWDIAPAGIQTYLNPLIDLPYYFLFFGLADFPRVVAFFLSLYAGIAAFLMWLLARQALGNSVSSIWDGAVVAFIGATGAAGLAQVGTTTNEWPAVALVVAGLLVTARYLSSEDAPPRQAALGGLLLGLAAGLKLTAAIYVIGASAALLIVAIPTRQLWRGVVPFGVCVGVGTLILGGLWFAILFAKFGNPVFPFYNNIFKSEWIAPLAFADQRFIPTSWSELLAYPFTWAIKQTTRISEMPIADPRLLIGLFCAPIILVVHGLNPDRQSRCWRFLALIFLISYAIWVLRFSIHRYVILLEYLSALLLFGVLQRVVRNVIVRSIAGVGLATAIFLVTFAPDWGHIRFGVRTWSYEGPELPANSLVALGKGYPIAGVVPFLRADARFVRDVSHDEQRLRTFRQQIGRDHTGPAFLLQDSNVSLTEEERVVTDLGLVRTDAPCEQIKLNFFPSPLRLCKLVRK